MSYNPNKHHRRSIRLKDYDYSSDGYYFITICTYNKEQLFGHIENNEMILNAYGEITLQTWDDLPEHYPNATLDEFIIMPNHIHCILVLIDDGVGAGLKPAPTEKRYGLSEIIRGLKTFSARKINEIRDTTGIPVWQRNYYEHIVRDEKELENIRNYIISNPTNWKDDENFIP